VFGKLDTQTQFVNVFLETLEGESVISDELDFKISVILGKCLSNVPVVDALALWSMYVAFVGPYRIRELVFQFTGL